MNIDIPIACNMNAMNKSQSKRYKSLKPRLIGSAESVRELEDGLEFRFSIPLLAEAAEFLALEKLCCPFLDFSLRMPASEQHFYVKLSGRPEVRAFLKDQFLEEH